MLFQKRVVHTKLDIYVFIVYIVKTQILQSNFIGNKISWHKRCKASRYPDKEYQLEWIRIYLEEWNKHNKITSPVTENDVYQLFSHVSKTYFFFRINTLFSYFIYIHIWKYHLTFRGMTMFSSLRYR
jgi:hypothetical protein